MLKRIENGTSIDIQGLKCWIPEPGYIINSISGEIEYRGIFRRSNKMDECYWETTKYPENYKKLVVAEENEKKKNPDYFDKTLVSFETQEWDRRLNGFWFYNYNPDKKELEPVYVTGRHYFYMCYWHLDTGLPKYRETDKDWFYFLQYCIEDDECFGMIEITKRRQGKTFRGGLFLYEPTSRSHGVNGGIQSKTGADAKAVFRKAVIQPFKKLPKFFRPIYDTSKGVTPTSELRFYQTVVKGKKSEDVVDAEELESMIDWKNSEQIAYDGQKIHWMLGDEIGKTTEVDVYDRFLVTMYCNIDDEGKIIGKHLLTTTVEEMEKGGEPCKKMWYDSDQNDKINGRTRSGLYRYFLPSDRTRFIDKYGRADRGRAQLAIIAERERYKSQPRKLSAIIRKEPMTIEEAFRVDGERCLYDVMKLNDRLDAIGHKNDLTERGNFEWENGERDTKVVWKPASNGRWYVAKLLKTPGDKPTEEERMWASNKIVKVGSSYKPNNGIKFIMGIDPIDHNITEDGRRSNGAAVILQKYNPLGENDIYNNAFVALYCSRPDNVQVFYEDMVKGAVYYGCPMLYENNKIGIYHYFMDRGYGDFMIWLDGREQPGIAATPKSHQYMAELTEAYIDQNINRVYFKDLIKDWLEFDLTKTTAYDAAMACGYALIGDRAIVAKQDLAKIREVSEYFVKRKVPR